MKRKNNIKRSRRGFTLIELIIVAASAGILIVVVGVLLSNGQKSWNQLYARTYGDAATDGYAVQKVFDSICRKSSLTHYQISDSEDSLELYYWDADSAAETPENYALFYLNDDDLYIEHGKLKSGTWQVDTGSQKASLKLAQGVDTLKFSVEGLSVQMFLTYQDPAVMPVICSSVRHNQ